MVYPRSTLIHKRGIPSKQVKKKSPHKLCDWPKVLCNWKLFIDGNNPGTAGCKDRTQLLNLALKNYVWVSTGFGLRVHILRPSFSQSTNFKKNNPSQPYYTYEYSRREREEKREDNNGMGEKKKRRYDGTYCVSLFRNQFLQTKQPEPTPLYWGLFLQVKILPVETVIRAGTAGTINSSTYSGVLHCGCYQVFLPLPSYTSRVIPAVQNYLRI